MSCLLPRAGQVERHNDGLYRREVSTYQKLVCAGTLAILSALTASSVCAGHARQTAELRGSDHAYSSYVTMINSAIRDEMVVVITLATARKYGVESARQVRLRLSILVAPFTPHASGFSTHVIYPVPGYGFVVRQVSIYPKKGLALFWLGYSVQGPGSDTGFNCTHSLSNCKIEHIPFGYLRAAFRFWWLDSVNVDVGNANVVRSAKRSNAERASLILRMMNPAPQ